MAIPDSERLIAFEAALRELAELQAVAARYRPLSIFARGFLARLHDLGARLRGEARRARLAEEAVAGAIAEVRSLRDHCLQRLTSAFYREVCSAYRGGQQEVLRRLVPELLDEVEVAETAGPLFQSLSLASRDRPIKGGHFGAPDEVAERLCRLRDEGLVPEPESSAWWDADLPVLLFVEDPHALDAVAAIEVERLPEGVAIFRGPDTVQVFAPRLRCDFSVVLAPACSDPWWEATNTSYAEYRDALCVALSSRGIPARVGFAR